MKVTSVLAWTAILILPVWGFVRGLGALFSQRLRRSVAAHPILHAGWFLLSLCFLAAALASANPHAIPGRLPTLYHHASGDFYWRMILQGTGREITRRHEVIFFYFRGHHGPMYFGIPEAQAADTRNTALRDLTDRIAMNYDERRNEPLVRCELLTQHHADSIDTFAAWWEQAREQFVFDPEADLRYKKYESTKHELNARFLHYLEAEAGERERIARDYYRSETSR